MPLRCDIVTQERTVFSEEVDYVSLPAQEGQVGILPNHAPLLTLLQFGEVFVRRDDQTQYFAVGGGIAEVQPNRVIVLADAAERADEIDVQKAQAAREEAEKLMEEGVPDDPDKYRQIQNSLRLAQLQLDVRNRRGTTMRQQRGGPPQFSGNETRS